MAQLEKILEAFTIDELFLNIFERMDIDKCIEFRGELTARLETMNSKRYLLEVRNDVSNLTDSEADDVLQDLIERFDVKVERDNDIDNDFDR